jgi:hypothetical protein
MYGMIFHEKDESRRVEDGVREQRPRQRVIITNKRALKFHAPLLT